MVYNIIAIYFLGSNVDSFPGKLIAGSDKDNIYIFFQESSMMKWHHARNGQWKFSKSCMQLNAQVGKKSILISVIFI